MAAVVGAVLLCPAVTSAADLDWSGVFVGLTAGLSDMRSDTDYSHATRTPGCFTNDFGFSYDPVCPGNANYQRGYRDTDTTPSLGLRVGRYWMPNGWLLGVQADAYLSESSTNEDQRVIGVFQDTLAVKTRHRDLGDLRVVAGRPMGDLVPYLTAGIAFARVSVGATQHSYTYEQDDGSRSFGDSAVRTGYVLGAGLNYALGEAWFLSAEYLYSDYGRATLTQGPANLGSIPYPDTSLRTSVTSSAFRVGLSRRF